MISLFAVFLVGFSDFQVGALSGGTFKPVKQLWGGSVSAHSYERVAPN